MNQPAVNSMWDALEQTIETQPRHLAIFKVRDGLTHPVNASAIALCRLIGSRVWVNTKTNRDAAASLGIVIEIN